MKKLFSPKKLFIISNCIIRPSEEGISNEQIVEINL